MPGNSFKNKEIAKQAGAKSKPGKHKKTLEWEKLGSFITDAGAKRAVQIMMSADDSEFMDHFKSLLNYFKPKITHQITEESNPVTEIKFTVNKK